MKQVELNAESRGKTGKGAARRLRRDGYIPAIFYGKGIPPQPISLNQRDFMKTISGVRRENTIFALTITGADGPVNRMAILKEVQSEPLRQGILHSDFYEVAMDKEITVRVPLSIRGRSKGVELGGILQMATREVELECLPLDIPETIEVDVSPLDIGESIHVRDLNVSEKYRILDEPDRTILSIVPPTSEEKLTAAEETAEPEVTAVKSKSTE